MILAAMAAMAPPLVLLGRRWRMAVAVAVVRVRRVQRLAAAVLVVAAKEVAAALVPSQGPTTWVAAAAEAATLAGSPQGRQVVLELLSSVCPTPFLLPSAAAPTHWSLLAATTFIPALRLEPVQLFSTERPSIRQRPPMWGPFTASNSIWILPLFQHPFYSKQSIVRPCRNSARRLLLSQQLCQRTDLVVQIL